MPPTCFSYTVAAIEMVRLQLWKTRNVTHIANIWNRAQTSEGDWFIPTRKFKMWQTTAWRRWCSGCSATEPKYKYTQYSQHDWCSGDTGLENFVPWWFLSASPSKSKTPFPGISHEQCMILWKVATTATNPAWYSLHGWGSICLGWYYQRG